PKEVAPRRTLKGDAGELSTILSHTGTGRPVRPCHGARPAPARNPQAPVCAHARRRSHMVTPSRFSRRALAGWAVAAGVVCVLAARFGTPPGEVALPSRAQDGAEGELRRGHKLEAERAGIASRFETKTAISAEVAAGRLSLSEAAHRFQSI